MDPNESQHHHHHQPHPLTSYFATPTTTAPSTVSPSPTNGLLPPSNTATTTTTTNNSNNNTTTDTGGGLAGATGGPPILYPHSVGPSSAAVTSAPGEHPVRRKRGRPRKYGTPEQALAAKKTAAASNSASKDKRVPAASYSASSKRSQQLLALGNAGQGFTPHVISVTAGEDVGQKLMMFMQQSKRDMCILSASGSISNASLRQPAMSGGNITYEGRFEIISLSGSYVRTDLGGRTGGLSVCLSNTDGQIIGGGVGGPLKAAGPVQVIVGTFLLDNKKGVNVSVKGDSSLGKLPSPVGGSSMSSIGFRSPVESSGRNIVRGNDDLQTLAGNPYAVQHRGMQATPQHDWRIGADAFSGRVHQSPQNGDYEQFPE